jgi:hypothetical protein
VIVAIAIAIAIAVAEAGETVDASVTARHYVASWKITPSV